MTRSYREPESFDLLLDTVCNAFGGVLFLAILVVVLLQMTSRVKSESTDDTTSVAELVKLEGKRDEAETQLDLLQDALTQLAKQQEQFSSTETEPLIAELREVRRRRDQLTEHRDSLTQGIGENAAKEANTRKELADLDATLQKTRHKLAEVESLLRTEIESRTRGAKLPVLRQTFKAPVAMLVRYGRLYVWHRYDSDGGRGGLNTDDFVVLEESSEQIRSAPKPYAGVPLRDDDASRSALAMRLDQFDKDRFYLDIAVWSGSFETFGHLRKVLVDHGFEYSLYPIKDGIQLTDRGGESRGVQ